MHSVNTEEKEKEETGFRPIETGQEDLGPSETAMVEIDPRFEKRNNVPYQPLGTRPPSQSPQQPKEPSPKPQPKPQKPEPQKTDK